MLLSDLMEIILRTTQSGMGFFCAAAMYRKILLPCLVDFMFTSMGLLVMISMTEVNFLEEMERMAVSRRTLSVSGSRVAVVGTVGRKESVDAFIPAVVAVSVVYSDETFFSEGKSKPKMTLVISVLAVPTPATSVELLMMVERMKFLLKYKII